MYDIMTKTKTMTDISYGFSKPRDLLGKLKRDGDKIGDDPNRDDLFNFFVTAAVLNEWIVKYYSGVISKDFKDALSYGENMNGLPLVSSSWIADKQCLPNKRCDERWHIARAIRICRGTANASKHYCWIKKAALRHLRKSLLSKTGTSIFLQTEVEVFLLNAMGVTTLSLK